MPDKNQQIKAAYVSSMSQYLDHCYRPRPYLAFLICGVPAGPNGLLTLCPRTTVDIETKTQEKVVRNAQMELFVSNQQRWNCLQLLFFSTLCCSN